MNKSSTSPCQDLRFLNRRTFLRAAGFTAGLLSAPALLAAEQKIIPGFESTPTDPAATQGWKPVSDRKLRVGIVGYGVCKFGAAFDFQNHPNVEVVAVSDLVPDRCTELARACRCQKTYPSLEELVKDARIEAVFVATDAPSHARHAILALEHGKHVACAVPAVFGSLDQAEELFQAARQAEKRDGLQYMMFETSCYHEDLHAMRSLYQAGDTGPVIYAEGEYYHYMDTPIDSFKGWRVGLPPQWYPTHSNAYYVGVTAGRFTEVSCMGFKSGIPHLQPGNNPYKNSFGTEVALFRTREGGMARMAVSWDTPGAEGEKGRVRFQKGTFEQKWTGRAPSAKVGRPPLPPAVEAGGHGGSHGHLTEEFVRAILEKRRPLVDISMALNMTVSGIVAHRSALKNGDLLKIPQY